MGEMHLADAALLKQTAFVAGEWTAVDDGRPVDVINPATGLKLGAVVLCGTAETRRAIAAAAVAQRAWSAEPALRRQVVLRRLARLMLRNADDLALILTREQGKPLVEAKAEIAYSASFVEWLAEEARRVYSNVIPAPAGDRRLLALKQPIGVSCAITPWNFPMAMLTRKGTSALAAGCSKVVKPATQTPLSALSFAELAVREGVSAGLLSVVTGSATYVKRGVLEAFTQKLVAKVTALKVGDGTEPGVTQGSLIDAKAVENIEEHVTDALAKGGKVLAGGKRHKLGGRFYEPTVLGGATADMFFAREETFGPLAPIFAFDAEEDAIAAANDIEFGLAAFIYSRDVGRRLASCRATQSRNGWRQHLPHRYHGSAFWRCEAIGTGPRRIPVLTR